MRTCSTCIYWLKLGSCATQRSIMYDNRAVSIPPGDEGQCRAMPPAEDNRWPMTMAGHWCGCWQGKNTLTEDSAPGATAAGETRELPEPDSAEPKGDAPAEGGKASPPVKPAAGSPAGGPPSLLQRLTGRGHRNAGQR